MSSSRTKKLWWAVATLGLLATACTTSVVDPADDPATGGTGGAGASGGTGGTGGSDDLTQESLISDCGGFEQTYDSGGPGSGEPSDYCDAEVLYWSYDATAAELFVSDNRIELNCCGDHDMSIDKVGDVYVVTETDDPGELGRCFCTCVFDFSMTAKPIHEDSIQLRIVRDVIDSGAGPQVVFEGSLNLTDGAGSVVIDDTPSEVCFYEAPSSS